jgi:hypothetical protein
MCCNSELLEVFAEIFRASVRCCEASSITTIWSAGPSTRRCGRIARESVFDAQDRSFLP